MSEESRIALADSLRSIFRRHGKFHIKQFKPKLWGRVADSRCGEEAMDIRSDRESKLGQAKGEASSSLQNGGGF